METHEVGLVFDLDNTLVQSKIDFRRLASALVECLTERLGQASVPDGLADQPIAAIVEEAERASGDARIISDLWDLIAEYEAAGMNDLKVEPGALDVVRELSERGHPLAVCTNNARMATLEALSHFGEPAPFDPVVSRDDVRRLKPSPDGLLKISRYWRRRGVSRIIMIGDSWMDGKAAAGAGALFIQYPSRPSRVSAERVPLWRRVFDLREIPDLPLTSP